MYQQTQEPAAARQIIGGVGYTAGTASSQFTTEPAKASEVERELGRLRAATNHLHEMLDTLGSRLGPVSSPTSIGAAGSDQADSRACSPLGSAIQDQRASVEEAARRVSGLLASLAI